MTSRPLGYIIDRPDHRDWRFEDSKILAARPLSSATSIDHSSHLDAVPSQLGNSCVGWSISSAAFLAASIAGRPIARPSALFAYTIARLIDAPKRPLVDHGSRFRLAMFGLRERGLVAADRWPETAANLDAVPPLDAFQEGEAAQLEAFYRIDDEGDVAGGLRHALARGYCPLFGMAVDTRYEQIGASDVYDEPGGAVLGNHAQVVIGYSDVLNAFKVLNSWGPSWGDEGFAWIAAELMGRISFDKWVISVTPEAVR